MTIGLLELTKNGAREVYPAIELYDRYVIFSKSQPEIRGVIRDIIYKSWVDNFFLKHAGITLKFITGDLA